MHTNLRCGFILQLSDEDKAFAFDEIKEDSVKISEDLDRLRQWVQKQPHLKGCDDLHLLLGFVRQAHFLHDDPRRLLEVHVRLRVTPPYTQSYLHTADLDDSARRTLEAGVVMMLPGLALNGSRVLVYRLSMHDSFDLEQAYKAFNLSIDVAMLDPVAQVRGAVLILDYRNAGFRVLAKVALQGARMGWSHLGNHSRLLIHSLHPVYSPHSVHEVNMGLKHLLAGRTTLIHDHGNDIAALQKLVPANHLPVELGGQTETYAACAQRWYQHVSQHLHQLAWIEKLEHLSSEL